MSAITDLRRRGKTVVLITHRSTVLGASNKLLVLADATARLFGPTREVLAELMRQNNPSPAQASTQHASQSAVEAPAASTLRTGEQQ